MKYLIQNKHWNIVEDYNIDKLLYLLIDRSSKIIKSLNKSFGETLFIWINNKYQFHRDYDLPAYIRGDGSVWWDKNNKSHRENNKPIRIYINGTEEY